MLKVKVKLRIKVKVKVTVKQLLCRTRQTLNFPAV
jgi:hypothetical protein